MQPKTVVLVEEDDVLREELAHVLRLDGHRVIALEDGFELCDYLELALYSNGKVPNPELIVSDVDLSGFGGVHICSMLSRAENAVPIILLAFDDEDADGVGAVRVLKKSGDARELHEGISGYLEEHSVS